MTRPPAPALTAAEQQTVDRFEAAPDLPESWAQGYDDVARLFHEIYERLAPDYGYETRPESAVPWEDVPPANRALMNAVVREVFDVVLPRRYVTGMHP